MSFLDNLVNAYSGGGSTTLRPASSPFSTIATSSVPSFTAPVAATLQSSRQAGPPDRLDLSPDNYDIGTPFGNVTPQGAAGVGAAAAQLPGYLRERPVAALDTLTKAVTGGKVQPVSDIEKFIGSIPLVGPAVGAVGDAFGAGSQFSAAGLNAPGVYFLSKFQNLPDDHVLTDQERVMAGDTGIGPLGALGIGVAKTMGDLRREYYGRGITPEDIQGVASGTKSAFDFGNAQVSSNPWASLATSLLTDPTNLLLVSPVGAGELAAKLGVLGDNALNIVKGSEIFDQAATSGLARAALSSKQAAAAIVNGDHLAATLPGLSQVFKVASRSGKTLTDLGIGGAKALIGDGGKKLLASQVALASAPLAIDFMADHTDKGTPIGGLFENLRSVADQMENDRPLSQNGLFSMYAAMNFPLHAYVRSGVQTLTKVKNLVFGEGELNRFAQALGVKTADLVSWAGSKENIQSLYDFMDEKVALDRLKSHPLDTSYLGSIADLIVRNAKTRDLVSGVVKDMRSKGQISMADRARAFEDWYTAQGEGAAYRGVRQQWDPELALKQWGGPNGYLQLAGHLRGLTQQWGVALGLNDSTSTLASTITKEDIQGFLDQARSKAVNGKVAPRDLQSLLDRTPLHKIGTKTDYWDRVFIRDAKPVTVKSLESKLGKMKSDAPALSEILGPFAKREADAPTLGSGRPDLSTMGSDALGNTLEGATIYGSRWRPELGSDVGLPNGASTMFEAKVAQSHPTVQLAEREVPKALAESGFPVQVAKQTLSSLGGEALVPSLTTVLAPMPVSDLRLATAMAGHVMDQDAVVMTVAGSEALSAAGVQPNGALLRIENLPTEYGDTISQLASQVFPGYTFDQTAGRIEVIVRAEEMELAQEKAIDLAAALKDAIPQDSVGGAIIAQNSAHQIYQETLTREAYGPIIDRAVRAGDPRVYAFDARSDGLVGDSQRAARLALSEGGGSGGVGGLGLGGSRLPRSPRDWGSVVPGEVTPSGGSAPTAAEELRGAVDAQGFGGRNSYVTFAKDLDQEASSIIPLPQARASSASREVFDLTAEEYSRPLTEAPTQVVSASDLVTERPVAPGRQALEKAIQDAYDAGDVDFGQILNRQAGGTAESGGAVAGDLGAPTEQVAAHQAILDAAKAGEDIAVRPEYQGDIKTAPPEFLVKRDPKTGEWTPLLPYDEAMNLARAEGRAPLQGLHPSLHNFDPQQLTKINHLEAFLRKNFPRYRLEKAPGIATTVPKTPQGVALSEYNALGRWMFDSGKGNVFSPVLNFQRWLTTPVPNLALHRAAEDALMSEVISRGGTADQVRSFMSLARKAADEHTFGTWGIRLFREWSSLPANTINKLAVEAGLPASVTEALGPGRFHLLVDRATSRFYRGVSQAILDGGVRGQISRGLRATYDDFQNAPGLHYLYDGERATAKVFYHIFRFISDPRWWTYNLIEADTINAARYGMGATRFAGEPSRIGDQAAFVHGQHRLPTEGELSRSTKTGVKARGQAPAGQRFLFHDEAPGHYSGWNDNRNLASYIIKAFDIERADSTGQALRNLGDNHPVIQGLRDRFGESTDDWIKGLDETMYRFDTVGVKGTVDQAARELEATGLMSVPEMRPFIEQIYNKNQQLYDDIVRNLHGNANRTNLERALNSYWLYWPISYQLKAGKWLLDTLTKRFAGHETNLGGLYAYENLRQKHQELMANDPDYAATFNDHPELWFAAQMLLPITPDDLGVSLNRVLRYGGSALKDATGGDQGPFAFLNSYAAAKDPVIAAAQVLNFGPIYTYNQIQSVLSEFGKKKTTQSSIQAHL